MTKSIAKRLLAALLVGAAPVAAQPAAGPTPVATLALAVAAQSEQKPVERAQPLPDVGPTLELARRYRRTLAFRQTFDVLGKALVARGFEPALAQAVVDTVLISEDSDRAYEIADELPGLGCDVLAAHISLVTTDTKPTEELEKIVAGGVPAPEPRLPEIFAHVEAVARRHLKEAGQGRALILLMQARRRAGLDCQAQVTRLLRGPASWHRQLGDYLAEADPLESKDGDYRAMLDRFAAAAKKGIDPVAELEKKLEERSRKQSSSAAGAAAMMLLRARAGDRGGAVAWARRAAGLASTASAACSMAAGPASTAPVQWQPAEAPIAAEQALRLSDLMARAGLAEEAAMLLGPLEKRWLDELARGPRAGELVSRAARIQAQLAVLAVLDRRDDKAFEYLRRSLEAGGDPRPALECLARLAALPGSRQRAIDLMDATTSVGPIAIATCARALERSGDLEGALARYKKLLAWPGDPAAPIRASWIEGRLGRPAAGLELLAKALEARPADPELLEELLRQAAPLARPDLTLATLGAIHKAPPASRERLELLLEKMVSLCTTAEARSAMTTILNGWGPSRPEIRVAMACNEAALGRPEKAAEIAKSCIPEPPASLEWSQKLLSILVDSSPGLFPATAARAVLPAGSGGWSAYYLARARSLDRAKRTTAAVHSGLLALDHDPSSPTVCGELVRLVRKYHQPHYLMGAFYLKTTGNPIYAPFQARYHAAVKSHEESQSYYRASMRAYPEDHALKLEYAAYLKERKQEKRAAQVYQMLGERLQMRYDRSWGPPLVRLALQLQDEKLFFDTFAHWLVQPKALDYGILRTFLRLSKQAGLQTGALALLEKLSASQPRIVALHEALAICYRDAGRLQDAARAQAERELQLRSPDAVLAGVDLEEPDLTAKR